MNIKTDYGFKSVFGNKVLLIGFVNALAILPGPIVDVDYLPLEQLGHSKKNRKAVYDVYVKTINGQYFIIEMQIAEQTHFVDRMLFYAGHATVNQAPKGTITIVNKKGKTVQKDWNYKLDGIYMITILDFVIFEEEEAKNLVIEYVDLIRRHAQILLTEKFMFVTIELPKFKKTVEELSSVTDRWLHSIIHMEEMESCPEEMANDAIMKELYETARINKLSDKEMETYRKSVLEYDDVREAVGLAKTKARIKALSEGEKRGRAEGRAEERNRLVKNLYSRKMSIKQIAEYTDLTEKEVFEIIDKS